MLSRQCLNRRLGSAPELAAELQAWETERNQRRVKTNWRFTSGDARVRLARLYPDQPAELPNAA